jgi:hypothetical protein
MVGIPPAMNTDAEDVVWALQTAETLWRRNERVDAIVWLRRAAQAAGDAQDDDRALALAREAAELSDYIAKNPIEPSASVPVPSAMPPNDAATGGVADLLRGSFSDIPIDVGQGVSMSAMTEPHAFMPVGGPPPVAAPPPAPAPAPPPRPDPLEGPTMQQALPAFPMPVTPIPPPLPPPAARTPSPPPAPVLTPPPPTPSPEASVAVFQSMASEPPVENVPSAAEKHAGMLDPWSAPPEEEVVPAPKPISLAPEDDDDEDVVTSARLELPPAEPAMVMPAPSPAPPPLPKKAPPLAPLDSGVVSSLSEQSATAVVRVAEDHPTMEVPLPVIPSAAVPPPVVRFPPEQTLVSAGVVKEDKPPTPTAPSVDLSAVEELADLPDDARAELQKSAAVHRLAREEEVMGFALAYVVSGEVDVAAQIVDAPAERLRAGAVLKAKGTVAESVPLRLIAATDDAVVATWDAEQIEPAFKSCPWVEDDLRASANRVQALVGITLGSLAERLDANLRAQVTSRLELRELGEGEVIIEAGHPIREMAIVGQGSIELVSGDEVVGEVKVGEFLFPAEILGGGKASATARAGKGGALLLASDRTIAQELMVTCPPLLEIFAGM